MVGHHQIGQQQVDPVLAVPPDLERFRARFGLQDLVTLPCQEIANQFAHSDLVLDHQDGFGAAANSLTEALVLIFPTVYAMTGGLLLQWYLGYNFSVAVWVGYIALFGIAVETGVVMVVYLHEALE